MNWKNTTNRYGSLSITLHWLMFLFEVKPRLTALPPAMREGRFQFFPADRLDSLKLPRTDREQVWPLFWKHRGGFFAAHCHCHPDDHDDWTLEASLPFEPKASRQPARHV